MFDFAKVGAQAEQIGSTIETGMQRIETRLTSIENLMLTLIAVTAIDTAATTVPKPDQPDVIGIMDEARETAARWLAEIEARKAARDVHFDDLVRGMDEATITPPDAPEGTTNADPA